MVSLIFVAFPAPLASGMPAPAPSPLPLESIDWGTMVQQITGILSGISQHPTLSGIMMGVAGLMVSVLFIFLKKKFDAWQIANANQATNSGEKNFVDVNTNTNPNNTNEDNTGRNDLNKLP